tara:strand:- start:2381 stop:3172 length:792 start_codon:yes stop_codon:yes gene_type:complete
MKVLFLGNCQVNAMRGLSREMFPNEKSVDFQTITPFWGKFDEGKTRELLADADLVVSQAIADPTTTFNAEDIRASTKADIVFVPYVYIDGIASLELIGSKGTAIIRGSEQLLRGQEGRKPINILQDYFANKIDMECEARVLSSLEKIKQKEAAHCTLTISDYLEETWRKQPTVYGMNHPTQHVVFEMYRRVCDHIGWKFDPELQKDPIEWGRRALPFGIRVQTPHDVKALKLEYPGDTHWYGNGNMLLKKALVAKEEMAANNT